MKTILQDIVRACYDRVFYQESSNHTFGKRFGRLYVVYVFVSLFLFLNLVGLYIQNKTNIENFPETFTKEVANFYPKDLEFRLEDYKLSINQPMPYYLGPRDMEVADEEDTPSYRGSRFSSFVVIDTEATVEDFDQYGAIILVMEDGFAYRESNKPQVQYISYASILKEADIPQPVTFDYVDYQQVVNKLRPFIKLIPVYVLGALIVGGIFWVVIAPPFMILGVLFNILFLSILGYVAGIIIKRRHSYGYIYKLGMYSAIPVIVLQQINSLVHIPGIDGAWWLIALLFMVVFLPPTSASEGVQQTTGTSGSGTSASLQPPKIT